MNQYAARPWAFLLALSLLLSLAACGGKDKAAATAMHLIRTEGTVAVSDGDGKDVPVLQNLGLYSGYGVGTRSASYAWINLDDAKLTKLDQDSEIAVQKDGKRLEIEVRSGSLFFNVTEPLEDDETMDIRTSTMLIGIRGTCGWVEDNDGLSRAYLLEGKVACSAGGRTVQVSAGEMAELTADGKIRTDTFTAHDIPDFVWDELEEDDERIASLPASDSVRDEPEEDEEADSSLSEPEFSWFRNQFDFVSEDTLPSETKELLRQILDAVRSENWDEAEALTLSMVDMENVTGEDNDDWSDYGYRWFYSEFDGYRIRVYNSDYRDEMVKGDRILTMATIEIRPKSGQGFYIDCMSGADDYDRPYTEAGFAIGQCENYNWTGSFERNAGADGEPLIDVSNMMDWND